MLAPERPQRTKPEEQKPKQTPPERPPPPKIFGAEDDPEVKVDLPEAPTDEPEVKMQPRNPRLYELVSMSQDTSFWWDSVDAEEGCEFSGGLTSPTNNLDYQFGSTLEIGDRKSHGIFKTCFFICVRIHGYPCHVVYRERRWRTDGQ